MFLYIPMSIFDKRFIFVTILISPVIPSMRKLTTILLLLSISIAYGQNSNHIDQIINGKRKQIDRIDPENTSTTAVLYSTFSKELVKNKKLNQEDLTIVKVYYVYTQYRQSKEFDQKALDRKRFLELEEMIPGITGDPLIEWEILEQTECLDYRQGPSYFHGFVLVHRPLPESDNRNEEIKRLMQYLNNEVDTIAEIPLDLIAQKLNKADSTISTTVKLPDSKASFKDGDYALYQYLQNNMFPSEITTKRHDVWVNVDFRVDPFGRIQNINFKNDSTPGYIKDKLSEVLVSMPSWTPAKSDGKDVNSDVSMEIRVSFSRAVNGMYIKDGTRPSFMKEMENSTMILPKDEKEREERHMKFLKGSTIYKGLNIVPKKEKLAVVMDVTGSMYMHIAALKRWVEFNPDSLQITSYSFFNDGDDKPTREKKKGETGGIYLTTDREKTIGTIETAMLKGGGGERPENDIEAVLYALTIDTLCDAILLIADNYSEIRDLSLLKDVSKPVNVLICEAPKYIRPEYLEVAYKTGGYLLMNGKKFDLKQLQKGDQIQIGVGTYRYDGNFFKMLEEDV